jgi:hypothetical protein
MRLFCGVELLVVMQQLSKPLQRVRLSQYIVEPFENFQRFLRLQYPFLIEEQPLVCVS